MLFYFVDLAEEPLFEFGNGSHVSSDVTSESFLRQLMPGIQQGRRFPEASMSHAFSIRRLRVSSCLAETIQRIQSRRAMGVMPPQRAHKACAAPECAGGGPVDSRALRRSMGTLHSGSSPTRVISTVTVSPTPAASCRALLSLSQWLPMPFGSRTARKGKPLIVPSTIVMSWEGTGGHGSFALAFLGRVRRVHDPIPTIFSVGLEAGRNKLALNRIVDLVSCSLARFSGLAALDLDLLAIVFTLGYGKRPRASREAITRSTPMESADIRCGIFRSFDRLITAVKAVSRIR